MEIPDREQRSWWTVVFTRAPLDWTRAPLTFAVHSVATMGTERRSSYWGMHRFCEKLWPDNDIAPRDRNERETWYLHGIVRAYRRSFDEILAQDGNYERILEPGEDLDFFEKPSTGEPLERIVWEVEEILIQLMSIPGALETRTSKREASGFAPPLTVPFDFPVPEEWMVYEPTLRDQQHAGDPRAGMLYPALDEFYGEYAQLSAPGEIEILKAKLSLFLARSRRINRLGHRALRAIAAAQSPRQEPAGESSHHEAWPQDQPVHIHGLDLKNLRCFQEQHLTLTSAEDGQGQWVVLLGENGMGKTTMLRAIALALSRPEVAGAYLTRSSGEAPLIRNVAGGSAIGEVSVRLASGPASIQIKPVRGIEQLVVTGSPARRPPVFAYGCRRGGALGGPRRESYPDPLRGTDTLFDESASLIHADTWLRDLKLAASEDAGARAFFEAVCRTLEAVLPGVDRISVEAEHTWVHGPKIGRVRLAGLSDGYLTTLGWVVDFIARWARYARDAGYVLGERFNESMPCVVLIDELDLHLHPRWQTEVVSRLRRTFPRTTFVATTHNPLTLHGTKHGEVHVIRQAEDGALEALEALEIVQRDLPPGIRTDQVLTGEWFGLHSTLDQDTLDLLDQHRTLLREQRPEDDPERMALERELRKRLGHYADTPAERLAQELVAEQIDPEDEEPVTDDDRAALRKLYEQRVARAAQHAASTPGNEGQ